MPIETVVKKTVDFIFVSVLVLVSFWLIFWLMGMNIFSKEFYLKDYDNYSFVFETLKYVGYAGPIGGLIVILPILLLLSPLYLLKVLYVKWGKKRNFFKGVIESAEEYCRKKLNSSHEFCLILRPFGNDSHFSIENIDTEYHYESIFLNWTQGIVLEQIIEQRVREVFDIETVAIVDPSLKRVPISPKFIAANHNTWKNVVFDLIKRALVVFILLPPGEKIRDSLIWEVEKVVQLGLHGRFVIILHPQPLETNKKMIKDIQEKLSFISKKVNSYHKASYMIYPNYLRKPEIYYNSWCELSPKEQRDYREITPLVRLSGGIKNVLYDIYSEIGSYSFNRKYIYRNEIYQEGNMNMLNKDLELFEKNNIRPLDNDSNDQ